MHVEPPGHAPTNLKELAIHYLMIVVGILTALGLEAGAEAWHHRRLAHKTVEQIEAELRLNLAEVRQSLQQDKLILTQTRTLHDSLLAKVKGGKLSRAEASAMVLEGMGRVGFATPTLRRDAWETALADQALVHLPREALQRYSEVYSTQRDMQQGITAMTSAGMSITQLSSVITDASLEQLDPVEALKMLQSFQLTMTSVIGNFGEMARLLERSLDPQLGTASAAASSASR